MQEKPDNKIPLSTEREKLFELLLQNKGISLPSREAITRSLGPRQLSYGQESLWHSQQTTPGCSFHNVAAVVRLQGELNVHGVVAALNETARRHEILRTSFPSVEGKASASLHPNPALRPWIIDLTKLSEGGRARAAKEIVSQQAAKPFHLSEVPLIRFLLLAVGLKHHLLVLAMHHMVGDGLSVAVLVTELTKLYATYGRGDPSSLEELQIQYCDYAAWQRHRTEGKRLDSEVQYWRTTLGRALDKLTADANVLTGARRPRLSAVDIEVSDELLKGIREVMRLEALTMFMVLLGGFVALLSSYGGESILVGSPIDFRPGSGSEDLIGFFVNIAALRIDLAGLKTYKHLFSKVKEVALGAFSHQDVPFDRLLAELDPSTSLNRPPAFPAMLSMRSMLPGELAAGNLKVTVDSLHERTAEFDLMLVMEERTDGLRGRVEYNAALFDAEKIKRMTGRFKSILRSIVDDRDGSLSGLRLLNR